MLPDLKRREQQGLESEGHLINEVASMQQRGMPYQQISDSLRQRNFNPNQISETMSQATIKNEVGRVDESMIPQEIGSMPPGTFARQNPESSFDLLNAPSPTQSQLPRTEAPQGAPFQIQQAQPNPTSSISNSMQSFAPEPQSRASYEMVEEIVESVVKEKWDDMIKNIGDIKLWKERMQVDNNAIKQEILRMQERFDNMQKAVMHKLVDYDEGVKEVGTEMKALEQVLQKILGPLTRNIKELEKVVNEVKKKKRK